VRTRIARIVELELATARQELGSIHPQFQRREDVLRSLPVRPGEAIARLAEYDAEPGFLDAEAKRLFDELLAQQDAVKDLEQFILRYGRQFQGPQSLDFEAAAELIAGEMLTRTPFVRVVK